MSNLTWLIAGLIHFTDIIWIYVGLGTRTQTVHTKKNGIKLIIFKFVPLIFKLVVDLYIYRIFTNPTVKRLRQRHIRKIMITLVLREVAVCVPWVSSSSFLQRSPSRNVPLFLKQKSPIYIHYSLHRNNCTKKFLDQNNRNLEPTYRYLLNYDANNKIPMQI